MLNLAPIGGVQRVCLDGARAAASVWLEPQRLRAEFIRSSWNSPRTSDTQRDHPIQRSSQRLTLRPIIEGKQVIVGSSVSLLICFQEQMTSADSCFSFHRKWCTFLAKVVKWNRLCQSSFHDFHFSFFLVCDYLVTFKRSTFQRNLEGIRAVYLQKKLQTNITIMFLYQH